MRMACRQIGWRLNNEWRGSYFGHGLFLKINGGQHKHVTHPTLILLGPAR